MSVLLASLACWCWPDSPPMVRRVDRKAHSRWRAWSAIGGHRVGPILGGMLWGVVAGVLSGPAVGLAAGALLATVLALIKAAGATRSARRDRVEVLACVRTLARELRSGALPDVAVRSSAGAHPGAGAELLHAVGAVRAAGPGPVRDRAGSGPSVAARLVAGWSLSARHGVPWAALIDALAADLAEQVRVEAARDGQVAGPRFSGYVLAALPVLGVLLGFGMGADPIHVLFGTATGGVLLLVGVLLTCAGLIWSAKIVRG